MKKLRKYCWVLLLCSGLGFPVAKSQAKFTDNLYLTVDYHQGYVLPEYQDFIYLVNEDIHSFELNLSRQTAGESQWHQLYNYPRYGISLFATNLGNDEVFGKEIALFPYIINHFIAKKRFQLDNHIGLGLSYVSKIFDLENNYRNIAVGSNLNIHFNCKLGAKYQLREKTFLNTGLAFNHFSNGNFSEPNIGVNYLTWYGGINYLLGAEAKKTRHDIPEHIPSNEFVVVLSVGGKHARALLSTYYYTSSLSFEMNRKLFRKFHFGVGADLFYDSSSEVEARILSQKYFDFERIYNSSSKWEYSGYHDPDYKRKNDFRTGVHLSQEFVYHKFSIILQEGIYLILKDPISGKTMYNRAVFRYKISKNLLVNFAMKSHLHILDYPEIGIGYYW